MKLHRLSALRIKELGQGNHADGGGLYLRVIGGSRTWCFRYSRFGKQHWLSVGTQGDAKDGGVTLAQARQKAAACRGQLAEGVDPLASRREVTTAARQAAEAKVSAPTFQKIATDYIAKQAPGWKSKKHALQWTATLEAHAAHLMSMPVDTIQTEDVLKVLEPIWKSHTETASRLRGRIESILASATVLKLRSGDNPAAWRGHLAAVLPKPGKVSKVEHHAALPWKALPPVVGRLRSAGGMSARCVLFTALTATRSGEARGAQWDEIDLEGKVWTVPAARMKAGKALKVPLSDAALAVLAEAASRRATTDPKGYVFPGGRANRPLSDVAVSKALHAAEGDDKTTVHGLRSTFRDWAAETQVAPREICELCLAHTTGSDVELAYQRSDLIDLRRPVMDAWGDYCAPKPSP